MARGIAVAGMLAGAALYDALKEHETHGNVQTVAVTK